MRSEAQPTPREELIEFEVRAIVAGTRGFNDYRLFAQVMDEYDAKFAGRKVVYLTGKAPSGADDLIIRWCIERGRAWSEFPADWNDVEGRAVVVRYRRDGSAYNVLAGFNRNRDMRDVATHLITFYDGVSKGTRDMIDLMLRKVGREFVTQVLVDIEREEG